VVAASLRGLDRGKLVVIPGLRYRALALVMKVIPGSLVMFYARRTKRL
jgi:short-subunit dehydrogenase